MLIAVINQLIPSGLTIIHPQHQQHYRQHPVVYPRHLQHHSRYHCLKWSFLFARRFLTHLQNQCFSKHFFPELITHRFSPGKFCTRTSSTSKINFPALLPLPDGGGKIAKLHTYFTGQLGRRPRGGPPYRVVSSATALHHYVRTNNLGVLSPWPGLPGCSCHWSTTCVMVFANRNPINNLCVVVHEPRAGYALKFHSLAKLEG